MDLLNTYKYGWKTSYYQNTYDNKKDTEETENKAAVEKLSMIFCLATRQNVTHVMYNHNLRNLNVYNRFQ